MTTTFRTSAELEELLSAAAKLTGKKRSEIIREAVGQYCSQLLSQDEQSWYDVFIASGFKPVRSGHKDLATNPKHLRKVMHEGANRHRSD